MEEDEEDAKGFIMPVPAPPNPAVNDDDDENE